LESNRIAVSAKHERSRIPDAVQRPISAFTRVFDTPISAFTRVFDTLWGGAPQGRDPKSRKQPHAK
jgi:hypothetical protein